MQPYTIIVPVYNEEKILAQNVGRLIEHADRLAVDYEIVIVSNGSVDRSEQIGADLQKKYSQVRFYSLAAKGVGRAFKKGFHEARHEHIIFMDADLSADLSFMEKANECLDQAVIVLGTKINGLQNRSLFRKMGSLVFYWSVRLLMGLKHVDYAPGAKAYRKSFLLKHIQYIDDFTSFVLNLTFIAAVKKERVMEIPIACDDRRKSRFNLWHEAASKYGGLFSLKFRQITGKL